MMQVQGTNLYELRSAVIIDIRSLLLASKDGLTERELSREYIKQYGKHIPYTALGFTALHDFLQYLSECAITMPRKRGNLIVYHAINDGVTANLNGLVRAQKDTNAGVREQSRQRESNWAQRYQTNSNNSYNRSANRFAAPQPTTPTLIKDFIQDQIRSILETAPNNQLTLSQFVINFSNRYGTILYQKYGYNSLKELLQSLTHIVELHTCPNGECVLKLKVDSTNLATPPPTPREGANQSSAAASNNQPLDDTIDAKLRSLDGSLSIVKEIIDEYSQSPEHSGIWLMEVVKVYRERTGTELPHRMYGFENPIRFIQKKLGFYVKIEQSNYGDFKLSVREKGSDANDDECKLSKVASNSIEKERRLTERYNRLYEIAQQFSNDRKNRHKKLTIDEYFQEIEQKCGHKIDHVKFKCETRDQLMYKLVDKNIIQIDFYSDSECPHVILISDKSRGDDSDNTSGSEADKDAQATNDTVGQGLYLAPSTLEEFEFRKKFLNEQVAYYDYVDIYALLDEFDISSPQKVQVSYITNPDELYFQFAVNIPKLEELMDELESAYYGIGASHYDIPKNLIQNGKLCAAIFPGDKNWHRCRIEEVYSHEDKIRVIFLDYGGEAIVSSKEIKFLLKRFIRLPIQAMKARLFNLTFPATKTKWSSKITDYLLKLVRSYTWTIKVHGVSLDALSISLYSKENVCLNDLIVKEGYATYDNKSNRNDTEFVPLSNLRLRPKEQIVRNLNGSTAIATPTTEMAATAVDNNVTAASDDEKNVAVNCESVSKSSNKEPDHNNNTNTTTNANSLQEDEFYTPNIFNKQNSNEKGDTQKSTSSLPGSVELNEEKEVIKIDESNMLKTLQQLKDYLKQKSTDLKRKARMQKISVKSDMPEICQFVDRSTIEIDTIIRNFHLINKY